MTCIFFSFIPIPSRSWHFCNFSLVLFAYPQVRTLQIFSNHGERGWGRFASLLIPQPEQRLSAQYQMHRWARFLSGPLAYGAGSHSSHKGTLVHGTKRRNVLGHHSADFTPLFLIFKMDSINSIH